jgi:hypothetical protein
MSEFDQILQEITGEPEAAPQPPAPEDIETGISSFQSIVGEVTGAEDALATDRYSWRADETPALTKFFRRFENPELRATEATQALVDAHLFGITPEQAYRLRHVIEKEGKINPARAHLRASGMEYVSKQWHNGYAQINQGLWAFELLLNPENEAARQAVDATKAAMIPEEEMPYPPGPMSMAIGDAANIAPFMLESMERGGWRGLLLGGGTALLGTVTGTQAIAYPLAPAMYAVGQTSASLEFVGKVEAGLAYIELLDWVDEDTGQKIDPQVARAAAAGVGVLNGALEYMQLRTLAKLFPGGDKFIRSAINATIKEMVEQKTMQGLVKSKVKQYGMMVAKETTQELAQESVNMAADIFSRKLTEMIHDVELKDVTYAEIGERAAEIIQKTATGFAVLGAPGPVLSAAQVRARQAMENRKGRKAASEREERARRVFKATVYDTLRSEQEGVDPAMIDVDPAELERYVNNPDASDITDEELDAIIEASGAGEGKGVDELIERMLERAGWKDVDADLRGDGSAGGEFTDDVSATIGDVGAGFFSALERGVNQIKQNVAPKDQWLNMLRKIDDRGKTIPKIPGVKIEELEWSGILDAIEAWEGKLTKKDILNLISISKIELVETLRGGEEPRNIGKEAPLDPLYDREVFRDYSRTREEALERALGDEMLMDEDGYLHEGLELHETDQGWNIFDMNAAPTVQEGSPKRWRVYDEGTSEYYRTEAEAEEAKELWISNLEDEFWMELSVHPEKDASTGQENFWVLVDYYGETVDVLGDVSLSEAERAAEEENDKRLEQLAETVVMEEVPAEEVPDFRPTEYEDEGLIMEGPRRGYRELLLKIPNLLFPFRGHYQDEKNILVWIRFDTRRGPNGERVLFIEEIQSDLHQRGRKEGYVSLEKITELPDDWRVRKAPMPPIRKKDEDGNTYYADGGYHWVAEHRYGENWNRSTWNIDINAAFDEDQRAQYSEQELAEALLVHYLNTDERRMSKGVPDAPLKESRDWGLLAIKRMVRYAAQNDFDMIAWTPGIVQVKRYEDQLRKQVDKITWEKSEFPVAGMDDKPVARGRYGLSAEGTLASLRQYSSDRFFGEDGNLYDGLYLMRDPKRDASGSVRYNLYDIKRMVRAEDVQGAEGWRNFLNTEGYMGPDMTLERNDEEIFDFVNQLIEDGVVDVSMDVDSAMQRLSDVQLRMSERSFTAYKDGRLTFSATFGDDGIVTSASAEKAVGLPVHKLVGEKIAADILGQDKGEVTGSELTIGGEGMKGFYDRILVNTVNDFFGKKTWGKPKVGKIRLKTQTDVPGAERPMFEGVTPYGDDEDGWVYEYNDLELDLYLHGGPFSTEEEAERHALEEFDEWVEMNWQPAEEDLRFEDARVEENENPDGAPFLITAYDRELGERVVVGSAMNRAGAEVIAEKTQNAHGQDVWAFPITDKMKKKAKVEDMPLFDLSRLQAKLGPNEERIPWDSSQIESMELREAVESGLISEDEAAVIDGILATFPQAWLDHFSAEFSAQRFIPDKDMAKAHGLTPTQARAKEIRGVLLTKKVGKLKEEARHIAVMFNGASIDTFLHEFGEFAYRRLLTRDGKSKREEALAGPKETWEAAKKANKRGSKEYKQAQREWVRAQKRVRRTVFGDTTVVEREYKRYKRLVKKRRGKRAPVKAKNEWFADGFRDWWLRQLAGKETESINSGLREIFRRVLAAVKEVYMRLKGAGKTHRLDHLYEDIITNGRDIREKYFYSAKEAVLRYIVGNEASEAELAKQGFADNGKTMISWDPGTMCPKKRSFLEYVAKKIVPGGLEELRKVKADDEIWEELLSPDLWARMYDQAYREGHDVMCFYCYVEQSRKVAVDMFNRGRSITDVIATKAKPVYETTPYRDAILKWTDKKIEELNRRGGLRLFSFGDYVREWHYDNVKLLLKHAAQRGLAVKVITKVPDFVEDFAHTGITINLSIDDGPVGENGGMPWDLAHRLKSENKNVYVRSVAMNLERFIYFATLEWRGMPRFVDVITPYHHEDYTKAMPAGATNFAFRLRKLTDKEKDDWKRAKENYKPGSEPYEAAKAAYEYAKSQVGRIIGADKESQKLVDWIEQHPAYEGDKRTCCMVGGKCFHPAHMKQCGTNCGGRSDFLAIPEVDFPMEDDPASLAGTPEFEAWFQDSKVVDEDGEPMVVFHATEADFDTFDEDYVGLGFHFGDEDQADARLKDRERLRQGMTGGAYLRNYVSYAQGSNVMPVYLSIQNPLEMSDIGMWEDSYEVARALVDQDIYKKLHNGNELLEIMDEAEEKMNSFENYDVPITEDMDDDVAEMGWLQSPENKELLQEIRSKLMMSGYDGIVYSNVIEGAGDSWIALDPAQIKSATGNQGAYDPDVEQITATVGGETPETGINVNDKSQPFTEQILSGEKTIETRSAPTLRRFVGQRVGIVRTGKGKAQLVGYVDIVKEVRYENEKAFNADYDKHLVAPDSPYFKAKGFGYVLANPEMLMEPVDVPAHGNRTARPINPEYVDTSATVGEAPKTTIRRETGQALSAEDRQARDDLKAAIRMAARNARAAYSAGKTDALATEKARIKAMVEAQREQKKLRAEAGKIRKKIKDQLRGTKVKKQSGKSKGRYGADLQLTLDRLRGISQMSGKAASEQLIKNLAEVDADNPMLTMPGIDRAMENRLLALMSVPLTKVTDVQLAEWQALLDDIVSVKEAGEAKQLLRAQNRAAYHALAKAQMIEILGGIPRGLEAAGEESFVDDSVKARIKRTLLAGWGFNWMQGWKDILDILSFKDRTSAPGESLISQFGDVLDAKNAEKDGGMVAMDKLRAMALKAFNLKSDRQMTDKFGQDSIVESLGFFDTLHRDENGTVRVELKMSRSQARKRAMEIMDPTLHGTIFTEEGMGWTQEMADAVMEFLNAEDKVFIDLMLMFYQEYYQGIDEVYSDLFGVHLPHNPNYTPIVREGVNRTEDGYLGEFMQEVPFRATATQAGALKTRVVNRHPLKLNGDIEVLMQHIAEMEHFKAWAHKMRDLNAIFSDPEVRTAIRIHYGKDIDKTIQNFLKDFGRGGIETGKTVAGLDRLRSQYTRAALAVKLSILVKQLTSVIAYADSMPVGYWAKESIATAFNIRSRAKELMEKSVMYRHRWKSGEIERDIKTMMNSTEYAKLRLKPSFFNLLAINVRIGDIGAIIIGGYPIYKYHKERLLKEGMDPADADAQAIRFFESVTESTQQSSDLSEQSSLQRGGSLAKLFTMFMSSPNQYFRKYIGAIRNLAAGRISKKQFLKTFMIYHILLPMLFQWVSDRFTWDEDEQKRAMILGPLNGLFIVGDGLDYILRRALGMQTFGLELPILSPFKDFGKALEFLDWDELDAESFLRAIRGLAGATGAVTGVPLKQGVDMATGFHDVLAGEYEIGIAELAGWSPHVARKTAEE